MHLETHIIRFRSKFKFIKTTDVISLLENTTRTDRNTVYDLNKQANVDISFFPLKKGWQKKNSLDQLSMEPWGEAKKL